jgi:antitoxin component YwqK of YwqJK toxin-antitoxin module
MKKRLFYFCAVFLLGVLVGIAGLSVLAAVAEKQIPAVDRVGYMKEYDPKCHPEHGYASGDWKEHEWEGTYLSCSEMVGKLFVWNGEKLAIEGHMVNGKRNGEFIFYSESGSIEKVVNYRDGEPVPSPGEG